MPPGVAAMGAERRHSFGGLFMYFHTDTTGPYLPFEVPTRCGDWGAGRIYETPDSPDHLRWFWSMNIDGPMTRSERVAT